METHGHTYFQQAISAIELIESATMKHQLADIVQFSIVNLGFPTVIAAKMPAANQSFQDCLYANTRSGEFAEEYFCEKLAQDDPVVDVLYQYHQPFKWSDAHTASKLPGRKRVSDLAKSYGMFDGYALRVPQMGGVGLLSVSTGREVPPPDAFRALHLIGTYTLSKFQVLERDQLPIINLHKREQECLQWIALG
jgi:Autoinducer binding domain